ncbi:histone acetyltransferase HAC12-like [Homalodisca vitripennis]|uniref:histone acetyltransferase HAC12-like n=1 Tax=Homalodisca vitripennis TaxID=197043 RepID=UPI001EEC2FAE|nr:histone acetyltransferase HAC12-like [Homalodisca vitripennis]
MRVQIFSFTLVPEMVRNYKKTSSRGEWEKTNMDTAFTEVKEGRMTCLGAARTYNVPEATLRRRLKKNVSDMPVHGGRYREVFNEEQLQDLHNYLTAVKLDVLGVKKKYSDPPVEEWIQCSKCSEWWHENCTSYEGGEFVCDYC